MPRSARRVHESAVPGPTPEQNTGPGWPRRGKLLETMWGYPQARTNRAPFLCCLLLVRIRPFHATHGRAAAGRRKKPRAWWEETLQGAYTHASRVWYACGSRPCATSGAGRLPTDVFAGDGRSAAHAREATWRCNTPRGHERQWPQAQAGCATRRGNGSGSIRWRIG